MSWVTNRGFVRPCAVLLAVGSALSLSLIARGQSAWVPTVASGGTWSTAANWTPSAPLSGIDTTLSFSNLYYSGGFTSTNNIAGNFDLNRINLLSESVNPTVANNHLTIDGSAGSAITFNTSSLGAGPSVWIDGPGNSTLATSLNVQLAADLAINATSTGQLHFRAALTNAGAGTRDITINTGNALVNWNPTSTTGWTGNLNLNSGYLTLSGAAALGAAGTNALVVNGGTLGVAVSTAIANNVTLNSDLRINLFSGSNALFTGSFSGSGGLIVSPLTGTNGLLLEGTSGFTGAVTANGGNIAPANVTLRNTAGALTGATSYNIFSGSTLSLDNTTSGINADRVRNDAAVNLHRANLSLTSNASGAVNETVGSVAFDGLSVITVNSNTTATGAATTLTVGSLSRQDRGTLSIAGAGLGTAPAATGVGNLVVTSSLAGDLVGAGAGSGTNQSILPYAVGRDRVVAAGLDAHVVVGANGLRPLTMGEYDQNLYLLHGTNSQQNVAVRNDLVSATAGMGGTVLDRDTTINALLVNSVTGSGNNSTSLSGPGTLTVASGSVVTGTSAGVVTGRGPVVISTAALDFGTAEGIVHAGAAGTAVGGTAINSVITGSGGFTKSGLGNLSLNGANTFSGQVTLNGGTLNVSGDANLGNASNSVYLNGGLNGSTPSLLVFQPSPMFGDGTAQTLTTARSFGLGAAGGGVGVASPNAELTLSSPITGSGALVIGSTAATGLVNLTGVNTHSGGTVVNGQLAINSNSALGSGVVALESGSVLRPTAGTTNLTISNNIRVDGTSTIYTPSGSTMTLTGSMLYSPTAPGSNGLTKIGGGVLELTTPSQHYGSFAIGTSTPTTSVNSQPQYEQVGAVVLRDNGSFGAISVLALNAASELVLDNTAVNVNNRLALNGSTNINGGAITLKGNSATPTAETIGSVTFVGANGMHMLTVKPDAAQNASLTLTSHSINTSSGGSWSLFRGDSLGSVPAPGVANIFIGTTPGGVLGSSAAPTLTNNVITGFVASASSTTDATSFATYSTTQGVQPLAAYSSGASLPNFTATNNVDLATPQTLTAATAFSANALRIRGSGSLDLNGDTLTLGTGMLLSTRTGGTTLAGGGSLSLTGQGLIYNTTDLNMGSTTIGGSTNLSKSGQGTLTLASANPGLTGTMNVAGGSLRLSSATSLPTSALVFVQPSVMGGSKLDLNGFNVSLTRVSGMGTVDLGNGGSLSLAGNNFSSAVNIIGTGRTVGGPALRFGSGMTLGGLSSFTGQTVLGGGNTTVIQSTPAGGAGNGPFGSGAEPIQIGDAATTAATTLTLGPAVDSFNRDLVVPSPAAGGAPTAQIMAIQSQGSTGTVNIGSNISLGRSLRLGGTAGSYTSGQATISGVISNNASDAGSVEFFAGNWNFTGNNSYSGGTTLANGTGAMLGLGHDNALGTGPISVSAASATLRATGGARTIPNNIVFTAATTAGLGVSGSNPITFSGPVTLGSTGQQLHITNSANTTFSSVISGGPVSGVGLTKSGGGVLQLTAGNSYTGTTRIATGALMANNVSGSAFGAGEASVEPGALLGGIGFVAGTVGVQAGGIVAPGAAVGSSIGTLTLGGLSTVSGSIFTFDLEDQNNSATNDLISLNGGLTSIAGVVDICPKPGFVAGIFPLFTYSGSQLTAGGLTLTPGFLAAYPSAFIDYTTQANTVLLNVPSPGAMALLSIGGVLAARRRRR